MKHVKLFENFNEPKVFDHTIYRIPTTAELQKFEKHPDYTPGDVLAEFQYTLIGRGILTMENKTQIIKSISNLCEVFPNDKRYKDALDLAKSLDPRF